MTANTEFILFHPQPLYDVWRERPPAGDWRAGYDSVVLEGSAGGFSTEVYLREGKIAAYSSCLPEPAGRLSKVPATDFLIRPR